ncbi:glycosyltransferase [Methanobrevibacter woesei]|uniref:glycosyltransferase n=1 Tax=Methanobrevibacter woesei TaxID=190976 RepID=UPI0023F28CE3|nr:glycosyltransferase [Methanobrevibacter woesei]
MGFKSHPLLFIAVKSKGNLKKIDINKKAYENIKNLNLISHEAYFKVHSDCFEEKISPEIHYLYYGINDEDNLKKTYVNNLFDVEFYRKNYSGDEDPILHYVSKGFFNKNFINQWDYNYITSLNEDLSKQFYKNQKFKIKEELKHNYYITDKKISIPYINSNIEFKTDKIRVGVFINDSFINLAPCPYIRIHEPFSRLSDSGKYNFFVYGMDSFALMDIDEILKVKQFDIVVVQRILPFLDVLVDKCLQHGIKMVYETDDDLLGVEESSPSFEYVDRVRRSMEKYIDNCDIVTVTTPALAAKFPNKKVCIIRNYYVDSVFQIKEGIKEEGPITLGYYGTLTHTKDLLLIKNPIITLKKLMKEDYGIEVRFEIIGGFNEGDEVDDSWFDVIDLPPNPMNFANFMGWLFKTINWDIGVVPLENSNFNKGKSELKYIELSVLGIPGVYSDMEVYNSVVYEQYNGLLAKTEKEWVNQIKKLILDMNLRKNIRNNAVKDVIENYSISSRIQKWDMIFNKLIN